MFKYLTAAFILAASAVTAGEYRPLAGNEPTALPIRVVCQTEQDMLTFLNTFDQTVLQRTNCMAGPGPIMAEVTPEFRYLDDQGDLTVVFTVDGTPLWTYFFAHHFDTDT